jgi:hypothetical protein
MSGPVWATLAGVGFGLFQSLNRQAIRGMDVWQSTFLQVLVSTLILLAGALATEDLGAALSAPPGALAAFLAAGLVHFFIGWTLLNVSQKRIGATRTGPLLATTPLWGTVLAAVAADQWGYRSWPAVRGARVGGVVEGRSIFASPHTMPGRSPRRITDSTVDPWGRGRWKQSSAGSCSRRR